MTTTTNRDKKARFDARLPIEQKLLFEKAASLAGFRSLTDFIFQAAREKADEIIKENEFILTSEKDSEVFFNALMNPDKPNEKLVIASRQYNKLLHQ